MRRNKTTITETLTETLTVDFKGEKIEVGLEINFGTDADEDGCYFWSEYKLISLPEHLEEDEEEVKEAIRESVDEIINTYMEETSYKDDYERYGVRRSDFI